jgi:trimeric autotransporter adhesin
MKHVPILSAILFTALLAAAGTAYAQQPPDVVQSDANGNTAMGLGALKNTDAANTYQDTAAGHSALFSNTIGSRNSGFGDGAMFTNTTGSDNTAVGQGALTSNTIGWNNVAIGSNALNFSTTDDNNTALGTWVLEGNITGGSNTATGAFASMCNLSGSDNTAVGAYSLSGAVFPVPHGNGPFCASASGNATATGSENTALGYAALNANTTGDYNTASGYGTLLSNTTGYQNTASGSYALYSSTVGNHNTASGFYALYSNTNGNSNTADGDNALYSNTTGYHNTASGSNALFSNSTGITNVAFGLEALYSNTTGSNNIAVGTNAGYNLTYGNNNIDIGNEGVATEGGTIRIGTPDTQAATYIAGIENAKVTGAAVYVTSSGQLGVLASSERYKTAIAPMGANTEKLRQLRPVSFHLKSEPKGAVQYGLIAEEVAKVYPELVIRDAAGAIQGVRYDELAPMLLNEVQKQQRASLLQAAKIASLERQLAGIQAALVKLQPKDELVAQR